MPMDIYQIFLEDIVMILTGDFHGHCNIHGNDMSMDIAIFMEMDPWAVKLFTGYVNECWKCDGHCHIM